MVSKAKWRLKPDKQDTENFVHLSIFSPGKVSDDFKHVINEYFHQNCPNFLGSMATSGLPNGYG